MEKTTVTIVAPDGTTKEFTGDTVLAFTVSDIGDFLKEKVPHINANSAYVGNGIPEDILADIIDGLVGSFIEEYEKERPAVAAFIIREVAQNLLERSERILDGCSREQLEAEISRIKESLDNIKRIASQHGRGSDGRE